ncbi:alpha/beta hydrolase [Acuticoccus sp. MNP-M23]|uniref:alpha/beta hydrolase n=1 Tax=Acuticoccus sp. MNP-M23 TaxID=3072793 RepID=UPI002815E7A5|nr:alpha/beta hydrolase [Acuticoccus sp. MNP-M23]WMS43832.1 alpha/beta hydrolase [Acuticoccus sp. MNP-M23]
MTALYRNFTTQRDLDAAYDVEAAVPDFMAYARQFVTGSAEFRARTRCRLGVRYGPTVDEYADIFPADRRGAPILIFIHGGFWRSLSAGDFSFCAEGPQRAGITTVVANYTLAPKATMGEIIRQMRALVAWTFRHAKDIGGNESEIYVCGHSAGGHLTAEMMLTDWARDYGLPPGLIRGGIPISGLFDLEPIKLLSFVQPDLRLTDGDVAAHSPAAHVRGGQPPTLLTYGSDEPSEFLRQSDEFLAAWRKAGNRASFLPQLGRNHFTAITELADPASTLCRAIFDFMGHTPRRVPTGCRSAVPSVASLMRTAS